MDLAKGVYGAEPGVLDEHQTNRVAAGAWSKGKVCEGLRDLPVWVWTALLWPW